MTKLIVFINQPKHLSYYNFDLLQPDFSDVRLVAIMSHECKKNLPSDIEGKFAKIYSVDFTSQISDGLKTLSSSQTHKIVKNELGNKIDPVETRIACIHHDNILLAAQIRQSFNIPGNKPSDIFRYLDKGLMKDTVEKKGIRVPKHLLTHPDQAKLNPQKTFDDFKQQLGLPFILKPTQSAASLGTVKISEVDQFIRWALSKPFANEYEVEEFIEGDLFHCDSLVYNSKILFQASSKYMYPNLDFMSGKPCSSISLALDSEIHHKLAQFTNKFLQALGMVDGSNHTEVFITNTGECVLLETGPRPPGTHAIPAYQTTFGFNFADHDLFVELNKPLPVNIKTGQYQFWATFPPKKGVVKALYEPDLQSNYEMKYRVKVGDTLKDPKSLHDEIASISVKGDNRPRIEKDFERLRSFSAIRTDIKNLDERSKQ